jgi:hypothetical protein
MAFRALLLVAPAAFLVAAGNFAHVDPVAQTTLVPAARHRAVGAPPGFQFTTTTDTADTAGQLQVSLISRDVSFVTAAGGEALPTHGLVFGRDTVLNKVVAAMRRLAIPEDTPAQRMAALDK